MYIFLDESGIHKKEGKSSVALIYISASNMDLVQNAVIDIEKKLDIEYFHWAKDVWSIRKKFIDYICQYDFLIKVALIRNPFYGNEEYEHIIQCLVTEDVKVLVIDGKKSKTYEQKLKKVLRNKSVFISRLKTARNEAFPALRIADAVAGIIRYRYSHPSSIENNELYNKISKKITTFLEQ